MRVFTTPTGGAMSRDFKGNEFTVVEEQNYVFGESARDAVAENIQGIANILGNGMVTYHDDGQLYHLSPDEVEQGLDRLLDGVSESGNGEMDGIILQDSHYQNLVNFQLTNGNASTFSGLSEANMHYLITLFQEYE